MITINCDKCGVIIEEGQVCTSELYKSDGSHAEHELCSNCIEKVKAFIEGEENVPWESDDDCYKIYKGSSDGDEEDDFPS